MAYTKQDASIVSKATNDASEVSSTGSNCSCSSRQSISDVHMGPDDALQELGFLHREMEQTVVENEGRFPTPAKDLESWSAKNAASSGEGTPIEPRRGVSFTESPKDSEILTSEASTPRQNGWLAPRSISHSARLSRSHVGRQSLTRKGRKKAKKKKKKEDATASPSSSNQRLRTALGPSLGSFGLLVLFVVGMVLLFIYVIAFRGGRLIRRPQALEVTKPINGAFRAG